jgi:hypothetical protein
MKHYVAYHNAEKRGFSCTESDDEGLMTIVTNGSLEGVLGSRVWLINGEGKPRTFSLCSTFVVEEVWENTGDEYRNCATGEGGVIFRPPIPLNGLDWFADLVKSQYNFQFGVREIVERDYIAALQDMSGVCDEE